MFGRRRKKHRSGESPGVGVVVYPDGSVIRPEDWETGGSVRPRGASERKRLLSSEESIDEIMEKYGKYLEDGEPYLKGINPNPKYYVVPKEQPPAPETPAEAPVLPKKVRVTKRKKPAKTVRITLKARPAKPVKVKVKKK